MLGRGHCARLLHLLVSYGRAGVTPAPSSICPTSAIAHVGISRGHGRHEWRAAALLPLTRRYSLCCRSVSPVSHSFPSQSSPHAHRDGHRPVSCPVRFRLTCSVPAHAAKSQCISDAVNVLTSPLLGAVTVLIHARWVIFAVDSNVKPLQHESRRVTVWLRKSNSTICTLLNEKRSALKKNN